MAATLDTEANEAMEIVLLIDQILMAAGTLALVMATTTHLHQTQALQRLLRHLALAALQQPPIMPLSMPSTMQLKAKEVKIRTPRTVDTLHTSNITKHTWLK